MGCSSCSAFIGPAGITWTPSVLDWRFFAEHLRFGLLLFLGGLLMMLILRSGEIVVATLSGNPMEIAYFNLAGLVMFTMYALIDQLSSSIIPTLAKFRASGEEHKVARWLGYSLTYFSVLTFAFLLLILGAGHWIVAAVWGSEFLPVANNLIALAAGLLAAPIIVVTNSLAMVYNRPEKFAPLAGSGLLLFLGSSVLTVPAWGALGASISVALGLGCAAVFAYILFRRLGILDVLSVSRFHIQAGAGLATLAVFAVPWGTSIVRAAICLGLYLALLFLTGILGREDIRHAARLLGAR